MFSTIAIALIVLLAALLIYAATRPDTLRVQRAVSIKAPPEKIFALIDDFRHWGAWSPYEKKDPTMRRRLSGSTNGQGAVYEWDGNNEIGTGRMEIAETSAPSKVRIRLDFVRPFEAHNIVEFTMEPNGASTNVTWAMAGPSAYVAKLMGIFINMDNMIGRDFESGLANLRAVAER